MQKDGRVLGLFDLLSDTSGNSKTPSKSSSLKATALNALATPSKCPLNDTDDSNLETPNRNLISPQSASKRNLLSTFLTPSTRRVVESRTPGSRSRSGVSKLRFDETPAFLRRTSQNAHNSLNADGVGDDALPWSPVRMRTKPAGRGLSALVRGLREMEEEKLDEDLDLLREIEAEENGESYTPTVKKPSTPKVLVEDSQAAEMPLGPDRGLETDTEDEEALDKEGRARDGKPLKVWKKKGQKRSTRRVVIRPVVGKWKPEAKWEGGDEEEEKEVVGETQALDTTNNNGDGESGKGYVDDNDDDELAYEEEEKSSIEKEARKGKVTEKGKIEEAPKKKKMVEATEQANFGGLMIWVKGAMGMGAGKFGRRR